MSSLSPAMRATTITVSGLVWLGLGWVALTQVPKALTEGQFEPPATELYRAPVVPPPRPEPEVPPRPQPPKAVELPKPWQPQRPDTIRDRQPPDLPVPPTGPASDIGVGRTADEPVAFGPPQTGTGPAEPEATPAPPMPDTIAIPQPHVQPPVIENPQRLAGTNPVYPRRAEEAERSGIVVLSFTVRPDGSVSDLVVLEERPRGFGFARSATDAVRNWTFDPQRVDGEAVPYQARFTIDFRLAD
jgi:periplasmic protein TonB